MTASCVIELEGLWVRFGGQVVLRDINLCVPSGEALEIIGGSGSGKTTLLREMLGLERPTAGKVRVFGVDWRRLDTETTQQIRNRCGVLFQQGGAVQRAERVRQRRPALAGAACAG